MIRIIDVKYAKMAWKECSDDRSKLDLHCAINMGCGDRRMTLQGSAGLLAVSGRTCCPG